MIFKGIKETRRSGCVPCGRAGKTTGGMRTHKEIALPSQAFKMFRINQETEVSDSDGKWLLEKYGNAFIKA